MYFITSLYASSMCAVGNIMYILSKQPLFIFNIRFCINMPFPPCDAETMMLLNGSLSACGCGDCLNSYCFTLIGSILGTSFFSLIYLFKKIFSIIYYNNISYLA